MNASGTVHHNAMVAGASVQTHEIYLGERGRSGIIKLPLPNLKDVTFEYGDRKISWYTNDSEVRNGVSVSIGTIHTYDVSEDVLERKETSREVRPMFSDAWKRFNLRKELGTLTAYLLDEGGNDDRNGKRNQSFDPNTVGPPNPPERKDGAFFRGFR